MDNSGENESLWNDQRWTTRLNEEMSWPIAVISCTAWEDYLLLWRDIPAAEESIVALYLDLFLCGQRISDFMRAGTEKRRLFVAAPAKKVCDFFHSAVFHWSEQSSCFYQQWTFTLLSDSSGHDWRSFLPVFVIPLSTLTEANWFDPGEKRQMRHVKKKAWCSLQLWEIQMFWLC